jgi:hypothetical protein
MIFAFLLTAATVAPRECPPATVGEASVIPPAENRADGRSSAPYGDVLGDAWEIEEVACWKGIWRPRSGRIWDGYWFHPTGERVKATLELWHEGRHVTMVRRHSHGRYCRYDGEISSDWWTIEGRYTCTWERTPMRWHAKIIRMEYALPALLREPGERHPRL